MSQRGNRQKRKQRQATRPGTVSEPSKTPEPRERPAVYARSEAKNQAVREALVPLEEGERPLAVTVGAVVSATLALAQLALFAAGTEVRGESPQITTFAFFEILLLVMAWGMWKVRYWAVLGFQALLALVVLLFSLLLLRAETATAALIAVSIIGLGGTLFYFMVKALARIQMPER